MPVTAETLLHDHVFLGESHDASASKTWTVIWVCSAMMVLEIVGGLFFGSIALAADGLHMSTHAGALLLAALAYKYARNHATDDAFTFGSGKFGDLAGFTSAIILAMIAILIGYESISRIFQPIAVHPNQITQWRSQLLEGAAGVFGSEARSAIEEPIDVKTLHAKIGELTLVNDFLSGALGPRS
jgi:cation diffusion facilitator family transporter